MINEIIEYAINSLNIEIEHLQDEVAVYYSDESYINPILDELYSLYDKKRSLENTLTNFVK